MAVDWSIGAADVLSVFGESVGYCRSGTLQRTITAVVERAPASGLDEAPDVHRPHFEVWVANDSSTGIAADEIDTATDTLTIPKRLGQSAAEMQIVRIIDHDNGMLHLEVR